MSEIQLQKSFYLLPNEVVEYILKFLPAKDLKQLKLTCKLFSEIIEESKDCSMKMPLILSPCDIKEESLIYKRFINTERKFYHLVFEICLECYEKLLEDLWKALGKHTIKLTVKFYNADPIYKDFLMNFPRLKQLSGSMSLSNILNLNFPETLEEVKVSSCDKDLNDEKLQNLKKIKLLRVNQVSIFNQNALPISARLSHFARQFKGLEMTLEPNFHIRTNLSNPKEIDLGDVALFKGKYSKSYPFDAQDLEKFYDEFCCLTNLREIRLWVDRRTGCFFTHKIVPLSSLEDILFSGPRGGSDKHCDICLSFLIESAPTNLKSMIESRIKLQRGLKSELEYYTRSPTHLLSVFAR